MSNIIFWAVVGGTGFIGLLIIGMIFRRLYTRASAERSFVRTGLGGQKVIMSGGAIVLPVFHETILINMNTLKLEVNRAQQESLITKDRMRVDVIVAFFVRVKPTLEGVATAAQTLGQRTLDVGALSELTEDKFVDALRSTAATMTMQELQDQREKFVQGVQSTVAEDLAKNGLELESVSLTNLNQTAKEHFNEKNAFDAEGLVKLTQETERRRKERNEIEQDTEVSVREKNRDALARKLEIAQQETFMTLAQEQEVRTPQGGAGGQGRRLRGRAQAGGRAEPDRGRPPGPGSRHRARQGGQDAQRGSRPRRAGRAHAAGEDQRDRAARTRRSRSRPSRKSSPTRRPRRTKRWPRRCAPSRPWRRRARPPRPIARRAWR